MPITLEEAERRALDRNPHVAQARLGTESADFNVAEQRAAYSPSASFSISQRSQTNPSTSQLAGGQTSVTNDAVQYGTGLSQRLPWGGGSLSVDFTGNRNATSNLFSTLNPSFSSGVSATLTQPLLRGLTFDTTRAQIQQADITRGIADVQVRQQMARTLNAVRHAYWELVYAADARETARRSEQLATRHLQENRQRVELGTIAVIDVLEAEAEVAARHQAFVQSDGNYRAAQITLKQLLVADTNDPIWAATLEPVERPAQQARPIDVQQAVTTALANRTDLAIARKQLQGADTTLKLLNEERKPGVDLVASYSASGIGGTRILRDGSGLGTQVIGTNPGGYADVLRSIGALDYPTWAVGVNITVPLGKKAADAAYARGQVEKRQAMLGIEASQLQAAADVTRAAEQVRSAQEQVQSAAVAKGLAERRLAAEQTRRDAGLSTTFLVLQAQRDLATAETTELRAQLDYRTALADFDLSVEAGL